MGTVCLHQRQLNKKMFTVHLSTFAQTACSFHVIQNGKSIHFVFAIFPNSQENSHKFLLWYPRLWIPTFFWLLFVSYYPGTLLYFLSFSYNKILSWLDHSNRVRYRCTHTKNIWALLNVLINKTNYYSFKIFPWSWLARSTCIIHHNQLPMTKFGRILCSMNQWRQQCSFLAG